MFRAYLDLPRAVYILCLGTFINRAGSFVVVFLTIYLSKRLGYGPVFATWGMCCFGAGSFVASLVGGHLADRIGRRAIMLLSLFAGAGVLLVFSYLEGRAEILLALFVFALFIDMYRPAASAMIGDVVRPEARGHAFGLMFVSINLGFACGAWLGGILSEYSFKLLFGVDAATTAMYAMIILLLIPETLGRDRSLASAAAVDGADEGANVYERISISEAARHIAGDWPFVLFWLGTLFITVIFFQSMTTMPLYMDSQGVGPKTYGRLIAINGLMIALGQIPFTVFLSRFDRMRVLILGGAAVGLGFGLTALASAPWFFALTIVIWTLGEMMQSPVSSAIVTDLAPPALRGRYMGVFGTCYAMGLMLGAPIGGATLARWGGGWLWGGCAAASGVAVAMYLLVARQIAARQRAARAAAAPLGDA